MMKAAHLESAFREGCIVVLGDVMLDENLWGNARRILP
jgi:bifunctional ADP-heptose synthase (sugar kinase/adenylyltransferase)